MIVTLHVHPDADLDEPSLCAAVQRQLAEYARQPSELFEVSVKRDRFIAAGQIICVIDGEAMLGV